MVVALPRWARSVRQRPAVFVIVLLLSAGATVITGATPVLVGAVDSATVRDDAAAAAFPRNGVSITASTDSSGQFLAPQEAVASALPEVTATGGIWSPPEQVEELTEVPRLVRAGGLPLLARLSLAPDGCTGLRATGSCPVDSSEALLPARLVRSTGWRIGTRVAWEEVDQSTGRLYFIQTLTVVGVYDDAVGIGRALADPTRLVQTAPPRATPNLVIGSGDTGQVGDVQTFGAVRLARPVTEADLPVLRKALAVARRLNLSSGLAQASGEVHTELDQLLAAIEDQQRATAVIAAPTGIAAVLLVWSALGAIALRTARARALEWGVGRMRGARRRARVATVLTEPLVAVVLGTVAGAVLAIPVAQGAAAALLGSGGGVAVADPTGALAVGVGIALVGSAAAVALAGLRGALLPLSVLLAGTTESRRLSRPALAGHVAVVSLTVAVVWSALTTRVLDGPQLGLLLPGVLALAAAVLVLRIAVLLVRLVTHRPPRSLTGLVVVRGLVRAPSALVAAQLLLVSAALAAFALQLGLTSASLQTSRAELATGASEVLSVRTPDGVPLLDAVRRADPGGRTAMAAEQVESDSGGPGVLALDTSRVAAVSDWRADWRSGVDLARLRGPAAAGPELRGSRVVVALRDASQNSEAGSSRTAVDLGLVLAASGRWSEVDLGRVRDGELQAAVPCAAGCRVVALALRDHTDGAAPWTSRFTVTALSTDRQGPSVLRSWLRSDRWRPRIVDRTGPAVSASVRPVASADGLAVAAAAVAGSSTAQLEPAAGPALVPALVGSRASLSAAPGVRGAVLISSLTGQPVLATSIGSVAALPRVLRSGVVVDLGTMLRAEDPSLAGGQQQVWLAPGDHRAVLASLRAQGVAVDGIERASAAVAAGLATATNRAALIGLVTAVLAVVFGLLALAGARVIDMPERRSGWRTLRLGGASGRVLGRLAMAQVAVPGLLAAVVGVAVGAAGAVLISGRLPLLVGEAAGPVFDGAPSLRVLGGLAGALVLLVAILAAVVTAVEVRRPRT